MAIHRAGAEGVWPASRGPLLIWWMRSGADLPAQLAHAVAEAALHELLQGLLMPRVPESPCAVPGEPELKRYPTASCTSNCAMIARRGNATG